ncbi:MAG: hypothetical protein ACK5HP_01270 [Bacilli bacterium]
MLKYIELNKNKSPITTFDTTHISLGSLENAGLLLNGKVVVVDFDGHNDEEKQALDNIVSVILNKYPTFNV